MTARAILASCTAMPEGNTDDIGLIEALATHGVEARWIPWGCEVGRDELVVPRATWDYQDHLDAFLDWCASLSNLVNPFQVIQQNIDKRYLTRFADWGLPVVPTLLHDPGMELKDVGDDFVIKPTIGAGSRGAGRFGTATLPQARAHLNFLHSHGFSALVQPYQRSVDIEGETSLVFFRGKYSHAFKKGPMLAGGVVDTGGAVYLAEQLGPADPNERMVHAARLCLEAGAEDAGVAVEDLVYARVDLVLGQDGPLLLELELTEPGLGFPHAERTALDRFAEALSSAISQHASAASVSTRLARQSACDAYPLPALQATPEREPMLSDRRYTE